MFRRLQRHRAVLFLCGARPSLSMALSCQPAIEDVSAC
jgi:hypothetical protein